MSAEQMPPALNTIYWTSNVYIAPSLKLRFSANGGADWLEWTIIQNLGYCEWVPPYVLSNNCLLELSTLTEYLSDISDTFSISVANIEIIEPHDGVSMTTSSTYCIQWNIGNSCAPQLELRFSDNGGANWTDSIQSIPNDGYYEWKVPRECSNDCIIMLTDPDEHFCDTSGQFSITSGQVAITNPGNAACILANSAFDITWDGGCRDTCDTSKVVTIEAWNNDDTIHYSELVIDTGLHTGIYEGWIAPDYIEQEPPFQSPYDKFAKYNIVVHCFGQKDTTFVYLAHDEWSFDPYDNELGKQVPKTTSLSQCYPNPFNPATNISFCLADAANVKLEIYNIKGQKILTLLDEHKQPGNHSVLWNGRGSDGKQVSSGIYFYRLTSGNYIKNKKMVFMK
jgi:hypothetical protein